MRNKFKLVLPEWTKSLPNDTFFRPKDVCDFFGFKNLKQFYNFYNKKPEELPKRYEVKVRKRRFGDGGGMNNSHNIFYKLKDLREFERKQNESEKHDTI